MRVYRSNVWVADLGCAIVWTTSRRLAIQRGHALAREHAPDARFDPKQDVFPQDIEISRAGIVAWLNAHYDTDNG